jgi:hypothetical protein
MTRDFDSSGRPDAVRRPQVRRAALLGTVGVLALGLAVGGLQSATAAPQKVLQSVHVEVARDGAVKAITSTTIRHEGDDSEDDEKTHDPVKAGDELPVRVLTAYRLGDKSGTDLDDLKGEDGRVRIDVTVQNTTVRPTVLSYDSEGTNRRSPALVGAPLTVVASADLGDVDLASVVPSDPASDEPATNGVVSRDDDGKARVQWATMLAPPRLGASATFTLVQDVSDFDPPSFDISVQPGLVTDTSVSRLVDSALGEDDGVQQLTSRTITLLGSVGTVLTDVSKVLSRVESSLDGSASELGTKTIADLRSSSASATSALNGLSSDLTSLQSSMDSSLTSSSSKAVAQLAKSFTQVKERVLGDPAKIDAQPLPVSEPVQGCAVPQPSDEDAPTVYGQLRVVQAQLSALASATNNCTGAITTALRETVGTLEDTCETPTALGAMECADFALRTGTQDLVKAQQEFNDAFDGTAVQNLEDAMEQVFDRLYGIRQAAQGLNVNALRGGLQDVASEVDALQALVAEDGALDTQVTALRTKAEEELQRLDGSFGGDRGAIRQSQDLAAALCRTADSPERTEAVVLLTGKNCDGSDPAAAPEDYTSSLQDKLGATRSAWAEVAAATADRQGLDALRRDLARDVASIKDDVDGLLNGAVEGFQDDLDDLGTEIARLYQPQPQGPDAEGNPQPDIPSQLDQLTQAFETLKENQGSIGVDEGTFIKAANQLKDASARVKQRRDQVAQTRKQVEEDTIGLLNPFARELDGIGKGVVARGKRTITRQRTALDREASTFRTNLESTVSKSVERIDAQVGAANRDLASSERQLLADLKAVLVNIGQPRQDGSGLLGAIYTGARRTGASNVKIAGAGDATEAFSQVRATALDDLYLQQAQVAASLEAEAAFPVFDLDLPESASHRTVFSFHVGQD